MSLMGLPMIIGAAVVGLVAIVSLVLTKSPGEAAEQRLDQLTGLARRDPKGGKADLSKGMLLRPETLKLSSAQGLLPNFDGLAQLYEQADVGLEFKKFLMIPVGLVMLGTLLGLVLGLSLLISVLAGAAIGALPFFWLVLRKRGRIKQFLAQMPDALELVGRALRAGHGLPSGLRVVAEEMPPPISDEFGRVFEEQNLGIPIEDALRSMAERVPRMEVRFFTTAVIIQRTTGGDLAEILDKIGRLIRERFQILGQVQALTAEGRISGILLLAMPPGLLAILYAMNPDYVSLLFTTPIGTKMLAAAAVLQGFGAIAIKKIITIKV